MATTLEVGGEFIRVYWRDGARHWVTGEYLKPNGKIRRVNARADERDEIYQEMLKAFSIDEIDIMTEEYKKIEYDDFLAAARVAAEDAGLIFDPENAEHKGRIKLEDIFNPQDNDEATDILFNVKLKIFELEEVLNSEDAILKKALREAKTPLEAFCIAGKFLYE